MKAPEKEAGKFGNLFWYDSNHNLVFIDANKVAADGSLSLEFSHASDYVIVYGDTQMGTKKSPKTGFDAFNIWYAYVMLLSAGSLLLVYGIYELNKEN
jgi:LPXTG-motif cell wall-anchored protein